MGKHFKEDKNAKAWFKTQKKYVDRDLNEKHMKYNKRQDDFKM